MCGTPLPQVSWEGVSGISPVVKLQPPWRMRQAVPANVRNLRVPMVWNPAWLPELLPQDWGTHLHLKILPNVAERWYVQGKPTGPSRHSIGGGTQNAGVRDGSAGTVWETGKSAGDDLSRGGGRAAGEDSAEFVLLTTTVGESRSGTCMADGGEGGARARR